VKPKFGNGKNQLELCAFSCNFFFVNSVVQEMHICALANDHVKCNELEQCNKSILLTNVSQFSDLSLLRGHYATSRCRWPTWGHHLHGRLRAGWVGFPAELKLPRRDGGN